MFCYDALFVAMMSLHVRYNLRGTCADNARQCLVRSCYGRVG